MSSRPIQSSDYAARFPGLFALSRDVLNLDWDFVYASAEDAVISFAERFPRDVASCAAGVGALLQECPDEATRLARLDELGWGYAPRIRGGLDLFLVWVRDTLGAAAGHTAVAG